MIEKRPRRDRRTGKTYHVNRVRWHDATGAERNKTFRRSTKLAEVEDFERRVFNLKRAGELHVLDAGLETLDDFAEYWWEVYAGPNLDTKTLEVYAGMWNLHLLPRVGHLTLREVSPEVVATLRAELERAGVGAPTIRKALSILQGMFRRAVEWAASATTPLAE